MRGVASGCLAKMPRVTMDDSVNDRGRVPAHVMVMVRKRRRAVTERRRRLQQAHGSDSDSDTEEMHARVRKRQRRLFRIMARNAMSYNMFCRPRMEFADPAVVSPLVEMSEYSIHEFTRFNKLEFHWVMAALRRLPRRVKTSQGCTASLELALFVLLRRWTIGDRWEDIEKGMRRRRAWLIDIYCTTRDLIVQEYGCVVKELDIVRIKPLLDEWDKIIVRNSRGRMSTPGMLLWIDGKCKEDCMPGTGEAAQRLAAAAGCSVSMIETAFYNGYYKAHGERIHHGICADGIVLAFVTSIRIGDSPSYEHSGLKDQIDLVYINDDPNRPLIAGGDQAYGRTEVGMYFLPF